MANTTQTTGVTVKARVDGAGEFAKLAKENDKLKAALDKSNAALEKQAAMASKASAAGKGAASNVAQNLASFATGANQALELINKIGEEAKRATNLAGAAANFRGDIGKMREATRGLVTDFDLMRLSNQAMALGVAKNGDEVAQMMSDASKIATRLGTDTTSVMESMVGAIGRQSPLLLDNLGIIMKQEQAQEKYAAALGKSVSELTAEEKANAFKVEAMKAISKSASETNVAAADLALNFAQFTVAVRNTLDLIVQYPNALREFAQEMELVSRGEDERFKKLEEEQDIAKQVRDLNMDRAGFGEFYLHYITEAVAQERVMMQYATEEGFLIDRIVLKAGERVGEEQRTTFEMVQQLQLLENGIAPAMANVTNLASQARSQWEKIGAPLSLVDLAITGAGKATQAANEYTKEWDWSTKKLGKSAKQTKDIFSEIGKLHQYDLSLQDIMIRDAEMVVRAKERELEYAQQLLEMETARASIGGASPEAKAAVTRAQMDLDAARMSLSTQAQSLEAQYETEEAMRHDKRMARLDEQMAREDAARRAHEAAAARRIENEETVYAATTSTMGALGGLATARKKDAAAAQKINNKFAAAELATDGVKFAGQAAANFAALNPVKGAALAVASAISFARAAEIASRPVDATGGGGGGGGGGSIGTTSPATGNAPSAGPPSSNIPGSGGGLSRPSGDSGIIIGEGAITVLGAIDDTAAEKIMQGIAKLQRTRRIAA